MRTRLLPSAGVPRTHLQQVHLPRPKKVVPRFPPDDGLETSCCRHPRSRRCHSGGNGRRRRSFHCRSLSISIVHRNFKSWESRCPDVGVTRVCLRFLPELVCPTASIAMSDGTKLWPLRHHLLLRRDRSGYTGGVGLFKRTGRGRVPITTLWLHMHAQSSRGAKVLPEVDAPPRGRTAETPPRRSFTVGDWRIGFGFLRLPFVMGGRRTLDSGSSH